MSGSDHETYDRPLWQILLKTVVTHAFGLIIYSQYNNLLHVPIKHNVRLFRLITFALLPTVLLGQLAFDLVKAAIRLLQNPHEISFEDNGIARSIKFYFDGLLGVRYRSDTQDGEREETARLLDVASPEDVQPQKASWTWKRTSQLILAVLAIVQATGVIVIFVRRSLHRSRREEEVPCYDSRYQKCDGPTYTRYMYSHSSTGMDFRNLYIACASFITAVLSIYLLIAGNNWTYSPSTSLSGETDVTTRSFAVMTEMKRLLVDFIIGAIIQEFIATETYYDGDGTPAYVTCFVHTIDHIRLRPVEVILLVLAIAMIVIFRHDIATRLNVKLSVVYGLLLAALATWLTIDTVALLVTDLGHFIIRNYWEKYRFGERWADPIEKWVPII